MSDPISTIGLYSAPRVATLRAERQLRDAQIEVSTGRHADVGGAIGADMGQSLRLRHAREELDTIAGANESLKGRLRVTQASLTSLRNEADAFLSDLFASRSGETDRSVLIQSATSRMRSLHTAMTTTFDGTHIFAGIDTDNLPLNDYLSTPTSPARASVISAFTTYFGFAPSDPAASTITGPDIEAFIDGPFSALFEEPNWSLTFSNASDQPRTDRINPQEVVATSATANEKPIRDLSRAYSAIIDLGTSGLNAEAFTSLVNKTIPLSASAVTGVTEIQARIGLVEDRVANAQESIAIQKNILDQSVLGLEGVDAYEAATRMTNLLTQVEASYAVTARLQGLSLLNYL